MGILRHNNPAYLKQLKAKRIADKKASSKALQSKRKPAGLVTRYNNGSNTRK